MVVGTALGAGAVPAHAAELPPGFEESTIARGLSQPVSIEWTPDGRMLVVEKRGTVRLVLPNQSLLPEPVVDLSSRVNAFHDRGLLGMAVDRDFAANGFLYLLYVHEMDPERPDGGGPMASRLIRVRLAPDNTVSDETVILGRTLDVPCRPDNAVDCIPAEGISHAVGTVQVDPGDGTLWVSSGDAASFTGPDPDAFRAYDERSYAGKLLHVDRDGRGLAAHPFCPADDDLTHVCTKVAARGFRNPFRFSLRADGRPFVGDVGWVEEEEVNLVEPGRNYGWPCWEAARPTRPYDDDARCQDFYRAGGETRPDFAWPHAGSDSAAVGGPEYTAAAYPEDYRGDVFFGDYAKGWLRRASVVDGRLTDVQGFGEGLFGMVDVTVTPPGELAYVLFGTGGADGEVRRVSYSPNENRRPVAVAAAGGPTSTPSDQLEVRFTGERSRDADEDPLFYEWDFGDGSAPILAPDPAHVYTERGVYTATLTVRDWRGGEDVSTVPVSVGNAAPAPAIATPADGATYRSGVPLRLEGSAPDAEDGTVADARLSWRVALIHADHVHPLSGGTGPIASFTPLDDHDADSYYRVTLEATDSAGLSASTTITLRPETVGLTLSSSPAGARIDYGGISATTPVTLSTAVGYRPTVSAPQRFTAADGREYAFARWSDGGERSHRIAVPGVASELVAIYRADKAAGRPATASSTEVPELAPDRAVDGSFTTRWGSEYRDGESWTVDLGSPQAVDTVALDWEEAYASRYEIATSLDGTTWTAAAEDSVADRGLKATEFGVRTARYVRVTGLVRGTEWGISFWTASVFGPQ